MSIVLLPFNKTAALAGDPVCISTGEPVTEIKEFTDVDYPIAGVLDGVVLTWTETGSSSRSKAYNIFMADTAIKGYVNVYYTGADFVLSEVFATIEEAQAAIIDPTDYKNTIEITSATE